MKIARTTRTARAACTAAALAALAAQALAFNPQPDPPAKLVWQNIDIAGAVDTFAYGINNAGQISGYVDDGITTAYGYVRQGSSLTNYDVPGSYAIHAENRGINNLGQVVGAYYVQNDGLYGFLHNGAAYQQLDPGGIDIIAHGINDLGQVVGRNTDATGVVHGWLYAGGSYTPLDHPGATRTLLEGINNSGQIVGEWDEPSGEQHGFRYSNGSFDDVVIPPSVSNAFMGMNNKGWMVGTWWDTVDTHGLLVHDGQYATLDIPGATFTVVNGINDAGTMVGIYGLPGEGNVFHAFVATMAPVPEPSSLALWAIGGLAMLGWRRRKVLPLALVALCASGAANAASDHWVQAFVDARGNGQTQQQDSGAIAGPVANAGPLGFHVADAFGSYDSSISGSAAYGHLWGQANAAQTSPFFVRQSDANADSVNFQDRLTLTSANLAPGNVVSLTVTMVFTDKLSSGPSTCCANTAVSGRWDLASLSANDQAAPGQSIDHQLVKTLQLGWAIGAPQDIGAILFYNVGSSPGVNSSTGSSSVDLIDAVFTLSLPSGVGVTSASGHDYTLPVPEPASGALMALGLAGLLAARRLSSRRGATPLEA